MVQDWSVVLSGSDARHVVVLRQRRQVLVQLLDALLVRFRSTLTAETLIELCERERKSALAFSPMNGAELQFPSRELTLLRLISSCRRWASVFPVPVLLVGTALPLLLLLLFSRSCSSSSSCSTEACRASAVLRLSAGLLCSLSTSPWPSLAVVELSATLFFLLLLLFFFFLMPLSFAPPFSFNPPDTVEV